MSSGSAECDNKPARLKRPNETSETKWVSANIHFRVRTIAYENTLTHTGSHRRQQRRKRRPNSEEIFNVFAAQHRQRFSAVVFIIDNGVKQQQESCKSNSKKTHVKRNVRKFVSYKFSSTAESGTTTKKIRFKFKLLNEIVLIVGIESVKVRPNRIRKIQK